MMRKRFFGLTMAVAMVCATQLVTAIATAEDLPEGVRDAGPLKLVIAITDETSDAVAADKLKETISRAVAESMVTVHGDKMVGFVEGERTLTLYVRTDAIGSSNEFARTEISGERLSDCSVNTRQAFVVPPQLAGDKEWVKQFQKFVEPALIEIARGRHEKLSKQPGVTHVESAFAGKITFNTVLDLPTAPAPPIEAVSVSD